MAVGPVPSPLWPGPPHYRPWLVWVQRALERYAVTARLNERFDTNDPDAVLDVYYPSEVANTDRKLPTIVWVHGGGFTSGSKDGSPTI